MNNLTKLLLTNAFFHFSRMFSGAVYAVLLLDANISLSTIGFAKGCQLIVSAITTIPTGVFADKLGRRYSLLISCFAATIYYILLLFPSNTNVILGECFNGLAISFYSGAMDSWISNESFSENNKNNIFSKAGELGYLAMLAAGILGAFFSQYVFLLSALSMCATFCLFYLLDERPWKNNAQPVRVFSTNAFQIPKELKLFLSSLIGLTTLLTAACFTGSMQLVYQYWQPFFETNNLLSRQSLGFIFLGFMLTQYTVSFCSRKLKLDTQWKTSTVYSLYWIMSSILLVSLLNTTSNSVRIGLFLLFQGSAAYSITLFHASIAEVTPQSHLATVFSITDFCGRVAGALILWVLPSVFHSENWISSAWLLVAATLMGLAVLHGVLYGLNKKEDRYAVTL